MVKTILIHKTVDARPPTGLWVLGYFAAGDTWVPCHITGPDADNPFPYWTISGHIEDRRRNLDKITHWFEMPSLN